MKKSVLTDVVIGHHKILTKIADDCKALGPELRRELGEAVKNSRTELSATAERFAADRTKEIRGTLEASLADMLKRAEEFTKERSIAHALTHATAIRKELAAVRESLDGFVRLAVVEDRFRALSKENETLRQYAESLTIQGKGSGPSQSFLAAFKGTLTSETVFHRGELWAYRGGTYLACQDGKGQLPIKANQKGANPIWQMIAAPGAPGIAYTTPGSGGGGSGNVQSGTAALALNDASKAVTFSPAFSTLPAFVPTIMAPSGGYIISCSPDYSTLTTSGVTVLFGASIPDTGYKLSWFANA